MPKEFIKKMGKYLAFLQRQLDSYRESDYEDMVGFCATKINAVRDICVIFKCVKDVWDEAGSIYGGSV